MKESYQSSMVSRLHLETWNISFEIFNSYTTELCAFVGDIVGQE